VLRGRGGATTFGLAAAVSAFLVGDALVRGDWALGLRALGIVALVLWVVWVLLVRPSIRVDDEAVTVVNVLRTVRVPWSEVAYVGMRFQIVLETRSGAEVRCWGGPTLPRPKPARRGERPVMPHAREVDVLRDAQDRHREDPVLPGVVVTRAWDTVAVAIGAACVLATVAAVLVP
jgi:hypothetical protein